MIMIKFTQEQRLPKLHHHVMSAILLKSSGEPKYHRQNIYYALHRQMYIRGQGVLNFFSQI